MKSAENNHGSQPCILWTTSMKYGFKSRCERGFLSCGVRLTGCSLQVFVISGGPNEALRLVPRCTAASKYLGMAVFTCLFVPCVVLCRVSHVPHRNKDWSRRHQKVGHLGLFSTVEEPIRSLSPSLSEEILACLPDFAALNSVI